MHASRPVLFALALLACSPSTSPGDGSVDAPALADADRDASGVGPCTPGDIADWSCVQGDPETHLCTDTIVPPRCVDGQWDCGGGVPDSVVDCWCHVGPWPWPEHVSLCSCTEADGWTCRFRCGPDLLCTAYDEYCARTVSDVATEPDTYACRPFESTCTTHDCECVPPGLSCEPVENGGTLASYSPF